MPNPMTPNIQTALPNLGFGGMSQRPEPAFFGQGGGFQSFGSNLRQITRPLAAGFAKDPNYRAIAAQQIATEQQMQQEQAAQLRKMVIEASLDNLGKLADSVRGVGSQTLMENPNSLKYLQRALESTKQSLLANGWDPNDADALIEQYGQKFFIAADMPKEQNELEQKLATLRQQFPDISDDELKKAAGAYVEPTKPEEDKGEDRTLILGDGQVFNYKAFKDGSTNLTTPEGRRVMVSEIETGGSSQPSSGDYRTQLAQDESSGGKVTKNPLNPNVSGKYQIDFEKSWPQLKGLDDEAALTVVQNTNAQEFKAAFGKDPTDADQYGMHRLGAGGYKELLSAPVGANVVDVVGEVVVEDNPDLAGKTVGDVIGEWKSRYGGGTTWRNTQGQGDVVSQLKKPEKSPAQSAAEAEIERFQSVLGLSPEESVKLQSGVYRVTAPDAEGNVSIIDMTTFKTVRTVNPTAELAAQGMPQATETTTTGEDKTPFMNSLEEEVEAGTGGYARIKQFIANTAGQLVSGEEFPVTQEATRVVRIFNNAGRKLLAAGLASGADKLSNQEQFWSEELLPNPDSWLTDPSSEAKKIATLRKKMSEQLRFIDKSIASPKMTSKQRAALTDYRNGVSLLLDMMGPEPKDTSALEAERDALLAKPSEKWTEADSKRAEEILKELSGGENP